MRNTAKIAYLLASVSMFGIASLAIAVDANTTTNTGTLQPMVVQIGPKGNVLVRGTVDSVGSGTITVKSWGGNWIINIGDTTTVMPHEGAINSLTDIKAGDFVGVQGAVNTGASWTIDAKLVRDWTSRVAIHQETQTNVKDVRSTEKTGRQNGIGKIFEGTASGITATSFTLTVSGGTAYTVNISSDTKLVNRLFRTLSALTLIQESDHVRVFGTLSGTALTAQVVRDTSLPH